VAYVGTLAINVVANTGRFSSGLRTAGRDVSTFTGSVARSAGILGPFSTAMGAGFGVAAVAGLAKMAKGADEFAGAMNRSLAIISNVSAGMRKEMELTAHSVAYNSKFSSKEAAEAYFFLASAGLDAKQSIAALPSVTKFAQAGNFDLAVATDLATDALSALGLKSVDAGKNTRNLQRVMDVLTKANTLANASVQQFSESLTTKAGAAMKLYGIDVEEGTAVLAAWADQGVKSQDAGTRFDIVLRDLTSKAILNAAAFEKAGIAVYEFGEIRNIAAIVEDMERAMGKMTDRGKKATLMQLGFTNKTVSATASLIGMSDAIRQYEAGLRNADGTTDKVADNQTDMQKAWAKMTASLDKMSSEAFPPVLSHFAAMIEGLEGTTGAFDESGKAMSKWAERGKTAVAIMDGFRITTPMFAARDAARFYTGTPIDEIRADIFGTPSLHRPLEHDDPRRVKAREERASEAMTRSMASIFGFDKNAEFGASAVDNQMAAMLSEIRGSTYTDDKIASLANQLEKLSSRIEQLMNVPRLNAMADRMGLGGAAIGGVNAETAGRILPGLKEEFAELYEEFAKATEKASERMQDMGAKMFDEMRTPMEAYAQRLKDINNLLNVNAITQETAARARAKAEASLPEQTFTPAMLRGSLEAYETIIKATAGHSLRDPAEDTAKAATEIVRQFPELLQGVRRIGDAQSKPGTVEVGPA
jgi:TP901 family phage tail tape measure protein